MIEIDKKKNEQKNKNGKKSNRVFRKHVLQLAKNISFF